ncbi:MAG: dual specificity protein phosphatase family protein [Acidobacteriota bacterium]
MIDYDRVLPHLYMGPFLESAHEVEMLRRHAGVTAVLNLQTDEDIWTNEFFGEPFETLYATSGVKLCRAPVRDFDAMDLQQRLPECVAALRRLLEEGETVYLHCTAGINRAPTVAIAYLHWCLGWDLDDAVKHVAECRNKCSPNVEAIRLANGQPAGAAPEPGGAPGKAAL